MNIVQENIDDLNAVIRVKIVPADYQEKYQNAIKRYQKKMDIPGFRPGKVPVDMVKKRFGKQILFEEINGLLSDSLHKYIYEKQLNILGNPLPKVDNNIVDFERQTEFEFQYELGLAPKLNVELSATDTFPYYTIKADDSLIDKHVDYFRKNYGQIIHPEKSEDKDMLVGDFTEIDVQGNVIPGGFFKTALIDVAKIINAESQAKLIGLKAEDKVMLSDLSADAAYFTEILSLDADKVKSLNLQFTLKNLSRIALAEVNQQLFDKIYGPGKVNSEAEFRDKIKEELAVMFQNDSDRKFFNEVIASLLKKANLALPEGFLKRYLLVTNKERISIEQIEKEYTSYADALKWQLIENHLLKTFKVVVTSEEAEKFISDAVKMNLVRRGMQNIPEEILKEQVKQVLSDERQVKGAYDRLYDQKLIELIKNTCTLEKKELSYDEFFKTDAQNH